MNSVKNKASEKTLNNTLKRESIIAPTKPTNITNEKSYKIKSVIITEKTFSKLFNKSTEKRLKQPRCQSSLLKKTITSSSNDIINDFTTSKKQR